MIPGIRPASDFELAVGDDDFFHSPDLLYHEHSHTKTPTIEKRNSRKLLRELAKASKPLTESQLSKLASIDRHTIRTYCKQFLKSQLVEWDYITKDNHTEKM